MASFNNFTFGQPQVQTMDINQALQNMSLNDTHNFRAVEAIVPSDEEGTMTTDENVDPTEINRLSMEIQDIETRVKKATAQTLELKGSIRAAYNLTFDLEVWEQIPIDQQIEFGYLETAVRYNDFFVDFKSPIVNSLVGLLEMRAMSSLEVKMQLIESYLPKVEENIAMIFNKLTEKALAKGLGEISI